MQPQKLDAIKILLFTTFPVTLLIFGGIVVLWKRPSEPLQSTILHFAAGVVFSVVAVEILPDMIRIHDTLAIIIGFMLGISAMLLIKNYTQKIENQTQGKEGSNFLPWGMVVAVGIDLLLDGLLLGIGFAAGSKEGILLALALAMECLSLGLATGTKLVQLGIYKKQIFTVLVMLGLLFVLGTAGGFFMLNFTGEKTLEFVLSFGCAALLFLVTEELLVEAHESKDSPFYTAAFFAGFLLFMVLGLII
ncbi:ZIP family metal transporter [Pedobacter suwonensis]|uniref:ZIP family metal transporter n=1 Tax=Pedobacter suwonensis TaxID=332999 RepID=UPI00368C224C